MKTPVFGDHPEAGLAMWKCPSCERRNLESQARCYACMTFRNKPLPDCKFWDATDYAHPAWWRGSDYGCFAAASRIQDVLDGTDTGAGVIASKELEKVRREVLKLMGKA